MVGALRALNKANQQIAQEKKAENQALNNTDKIKVTPFASNACYTCSLTSQGKKVNTSYYEALTTTDGQEISRGICGICYLNDELKNYTIYSAQGNLVRDKIT